MARLTSVFPLLLAISAAGCATKAQFRARMDEFVGRPIAAAQEAFGYGYAVKDLEDGSRAYSWVTVKTGVAPGYQSPTVIETLRSSDQTRTTTVMPGTYYPPYVYRDVCEFTLIADGSGTIARWNARGAGCKGQPAGLVLRSEP
jgi:hypothetical protein